VAHLIRVNNTAFLKAIFGQNWHLAHVTAFEDDPSAIEKDRRGLCWAGGIAKQRIDYFKASQNQYFCISLFEPDSTTGNFYRRKDLFRSCHVIVADDVREKLPVERVEKLPAPSYKLMTSNGSEQWGWILAVPCEDRDKINNLLDGLVAQGLAPDGVDPGMKGVTRYIRLPNGVNSKYNKYEDGKPFAVRLIEWNPRSKHNIESLAEVFGIDLLAAREENSTGSVAVAPSDPIAKNHPILAHVDVESVGHDGWLRLAECPNASKHSGNDPTGAAIQILSTGDVNFMCHHGHCNGEKAQKVTGPRAIQLLEKQGAVGLAEDCLRYKARVGYEGAQMLAEQLAAKKATAEAVGGGDVEVDGQGAGFGPFKKMDPLRYIYIAPLHRFYDIESGETLSCDAIKMLYNREYPGGKKSLTADKALLELLEPETGYADGFGWNPSSWVRPAREALIYTDNGRRLINTWSGFALTPMPGDVSLWLDHADYLFPNPREREVVLDYLAFLCQQPMRKPAYFLCHRGSHRIGKDLFYRPVIEALGHKAAREVTIDQLLNGWGNYVLGLKLVIVTEVDKMQDKKVTNALKTWVAPTAGGIRQVNLKGGRIVEQRDAMGGVMMSNKRHCIAIEPGDKRYFVTDSWIEPREADYYKEIDTWLNHGGAGAVLDYLLNRDLGEFNPMQLPFMTEGAQEMVRSGRHDYEQDLEMLIEEKVPPFHMDVFTVKEVKNACREHGIKGGNNGIEDALRRLGYIKMRGTAKIDGVMANTPTFFALEEHKNKSPRDLYTLYVERA